eukprot:GHUV01043048.1.p2 GENE.GHUV01043048.1~~GHUV01043048.1.p2  ORF type:complete len:127 (+),score=45.64 GHUV01043048.1:781-1161(+)
MFECLLAVCGPDPSSLLCVCVHSLQVPYYPPLQSPADFTPEFCKQVIAAAAGWPLQQLLQNQAVSSSAVGSGHTNSSNNSSSSTSSGFQLCSVKNWVMSTLVADEYAAWGNRVILVGDSAHRYVEH